MKPRKPDHVKLNQDASLMHIPGVGTRPVVGVDNKQLSEREREHARKKVLIERQLMSTWKCTQCKRIWPGTKVRVTVRNIGGIKSEVLVCPDLKCDGPVIVERDALDLTRTKT